MGWQENCDGKEASVKEKYTYITVGVSIVVYFIHDLFDL